LRIKVLHKLYSHVADLNENYFAGICFISAFAVFIRFIVKIKSHATSDAVG